MDYYTLQMPETPRAVLGTVERGTKEIRAIQLSKEHNATIDSVRDKLRSLHPNDPDIVVQKNNIWGVQRLIQVSRSIGDAYPKRTEFNKEPLLSKFQLPKPFYEPILRPEPELSVHRIQPEEKGIVKRLVKAALKEGAKKKAIR